jgi:hypothetical protein
MWVEGRRAPKVHASGRLFLKNGPCDCGASSAAPIHSSVSMPHKTHEDVLALLFGAAGLAFLLHCATGWNFSVVFFVINLPFCGAVWPRIGPVFAGNLFGVGPAHRCGHVDAVSAPSELGWLQRFGVVPARTVRLARKQGSDGHGLRQRGGVACRGGPGEHRSVCIGRGGAQPHAGVQPQPWELHGGVKPCQARPE